ncbi:MAG TPA: hypothetical protein VIF37_07800 [Methylobacter sp.]
MPTWTDICSCNICIHHIHVDYVGKEREHDCMDAGGRATQGAVAEERKLFRYPDCRKRPPLLSPGGLIPA